MIIKNLLSANLLGIECAIIGAILFAISNEKIVNWWFVFGSRIGSYQKKMEGGTIEQQRWFYRPIWGCGKCFSGQLAAWVYLFSHIHPGSLMACFTGNVRACMHLFPGYSLFEHIIAVCTSILFAVFLTDKIKNII